VAASPGSVPELDPPIHRDGLGPEELAFFARLATLAPDDAVEVMRADFESYVAQLDPADADDTVLARRFLTQLDPRDAELITRPGPVVDGRVLGSDSAIAAAVREALANPAGYLRDVAISFTSWDFGPERITCPAFLWYGASDANASPRNGHWLAGRIPQATLVIREQTTHLAVLHEYWDEILAALRLA
jgi:pimeloyl-ACP methyl ester carboxylesterase